jgi:hypothetical protein
MPSTVRVIKSSSLSSTLITDLFQISYASKYLDAFEIAKLTDIFHKR